MNYTKLGNFEAICLIVVLFINHIVLNLPQMILDATGSASILNCLYIFIIVLIFALLIIFFSSFIYPAPRHKKSVHPCAGNGRKNSPVLKPGSHSSSL